MSIRIQDRLGTLSQARSDLALLGRFLVFRDAQNELVMNSLSVQDRAFLIPERSGRWSLLSGAERLQGVIPRSQMLGLLDTSSILSIGQRLRDVFEQNGTWIDALGISPLAPGMAKRAEIQRFEQVLLDGVGHLEEICRRPRTHLRVDVERLPVSRARRFPAQAGNFLAAHTEDWERPNLRSVVPKRILATVREDQFDIYENRVAARLIDNLTVYLGQRVQEVARLLRVFDEAMGNHESAASGSHWRQKRIYSLWSEAVDGSDARRKAEHTLQQLKHLFYKIAGLKDSVLYREVPRRSLVSTTLRMTNILSDDTHYRRMARIWLEWARLGSDQSVTPSMFFDELQQLCQSFNQFVLLLTCRALDQLGFQPMDLDKSLSDRVVEVCHGTQSLRLSWGSADDHIQIQGDGIGGLTIVPLCSSIAALDNQQVRNLIDDVDRHGTNGGTMVVIYPTPADVSSFDRLDPELSARLRAFSHDLEFTGQQRVGFMPVSPWDIGSVERVARQIRWAATVPLFSKYPPSLRRCDAAEIGCKWGWLEESSRGVFLVRPPSEHEQIPVADLIRRIASDIAALESERDDVDCKLRHAVRDRNKTGSLNVRKRDLNVRLTQAENDLERLKRFATDLAASISSVGDLLECPACRRIADPRREFQPKGRTFSCTCSSCRTTWGTISCGGCSRVIPTMRMHGLDPSKGSSHPAWIDRYLGSDCLAIPRFVASGIEFGCPYCAYSALDARG